MLIVLNEYYLLLGNFLKCKVRGPQGVATGRFADLGLGTSDRATQVRQQAKQVNAKCSTVVLYRRKVEAYHTEMRTESAGGGPRRTVADRSSDLWFAFPSRHVVVVSTL